MAAALACGTSSLISHRSAAALWGLIRWNGRNAEVAVEGSSRRSHRGITIHRTRQLPPDDRGHHHGIPVTSVPRTLVDLAGVLDANALRRALEEADRLGLLRLAAVLSACDRANGRRGVGALRGILADHTVAPDTLSPLEDALLAFCREHRIALPQTNVMLAGWLVDAYWPAGKLVVELDSWEFHADRAQFDRDRRKGLAIQDAGYGFTRLSAPQLAGNEGDETAAMLQRKLALGA